MLLDQVGRGQANTNFQLGRGQANTNFDRDAVAIGEAAQRPKLHPVPVKDIAQQDLVLVIQVRARMQRERTALANQIRRFALE